MRWTELWRIESGDIIGIIGHAPSVVEVTDINLADGVYEQHQASWHHANTHGRTTMSHLALVDLIQCSPHGDPRREALGMPEHPQIMR